MIADESVHRTTHHLAKGVSLNSGSFLQLLTIVIRHTTYRSHCQVLTSILVDIAAEMLAEVVNHHPLQGFHREMLMDKP